MAVPPIQASIPTTVEPIASSKSSSSLDDKKASLPSSARSVPSEENLSLLKVNPFADPRAAAQWKQRYDDCEYECRYVFDPALEWTEEEEKKIVRKLDWRVCLWACIMFFALQVDRNNLTQVVSDNFLDDLYINTNDYNIGNTIFLLSFFVAELPSQLGGFIPDVVLWLSYFYTSKELPIRLSYFWTTLSATGVITSLLAFALLRLRGVLGWAGWRWLFLIEGIVTFTIGVSSFFMMPASAVQTKTWFRPNGWFTDREMAIVVNRVLRDDPSKGDMNNRQAITPKILWACLTDVDLWPLYLLGLIVYIPQAPPSKYITLILRNVGFDTFTTNLLTIPYNVLHIITLLLLTRLSDYLNERTLVSSIQNIWILPTIAALRWWPGSVTDAWGTYALITVLLGYPYCHAIVVAWVSRNSNSVGTRSVSAAVYNMSVQAGNIIANFIYLDDDKPLYRRGNSVLFAINVLGIAVFFSTKAYYVWRNKQREKIWNAMTEEERIYYISNTTASGSRRLDFRFAH
ncbi:hypothetical protein NPX13_g7545 [Xylaria arbuscula]|uniref:Major facilitator superfamily (MFS) profile domain-containing protein n=1 Tax=Xylaria arbuscula TaxID=114810 RepID=A0A9W8NAF7_9PEZI|nr:hypothetical protein NPX13_g7545 [Xylaria arbuscula]